MCLWYITRRKTSLGKNTNFIYSISVVTSGGEVNAQLIEYIYIYIYISNYRTGHDGAASCNANFSCHSLNMY